MKLLNSENNFCSIYSLAIKYHLILFYQNGGTEIIDRKEDQTCQRFILSSQVHIEDQARG